MKHNQHKTIKQSIAIYSKPEYIWSILSDFSNYLNWNSCIVEVVATNRKKFKYSIYIRDTNNKIIKFASKLNHFMPYHHMSWSGKIINDKIFRHQISFELLPQDNYVNCVFTLSLAGLFSPSYDFVVIQFYANIAKMLVELKNICELDKTQIQ